MLHPIVLRAILSLMRVSLTIRGGKKKMDKKTYIGSDVALGNKNSDEYIAYLEHKMLTQLECYRCIECERVVTDNDVIKFETGDFCCPDCSDKHTRKLEREMDLWDSMQTAAEDAYRNR